MFDSGGKSNHQDINAGWSISIQLPTLNPCDVENILSQPLGHWDTREPSNGLLCQDDFQVTNLEAIFQEELKEDVASGLTEIQGGDKEKVGDRFAQNAVQTTEIRCDGEKKKNARLQQGSTFSKLTDEKKGKCMLDDFLWNLLEKPQYNSYIQWTMKDRLEFKLTRPEMVAQLWGQHRKKKRMNFDKLSRCLRYYYDSKRMSKVPYKQHHFQFLNRDKCKSKK